MAQHGRGQDLGALRHADTGAQHDDGGRAVAQRPPRGLCRDPEGGSVRHYGRGRDLAGGATAERLHGRDGPGGQLTWGNHAAHPGLARRGS